MAKSKEATTDPREFVWFEWKAGLFNQVWISLKHYSDVVKMKRDTD